MMTGIVRERWAKVLTLVALVYSVVFECRAINRTWTGAGNGSIKLWSDPSNWEPNALPQTGDNLIFYNVDETTMRNDLPNLTVRSLTFGGSSLGQLLTVSVWVLDGYPLTVTSAINHVEDNNVTVKINCGLRLGGDLVISAGKTSAIALIQNQDMPIYLNGPIDLNGHNLTLAAYSGEPNSGAYVGHLVVTGGISGQGALTVETHVPNNWPVEPVSCSIEFAGAGNTFTGEGLWAGLDFGTTLTLNVASGVAVPGLLIGFPQNFGVPESGCRILCKRPGQFGTSAALSMGDMILDLDGNDTELRNVSFGAGYSAGGIETRSGQLTIHGYLEAGNYSYKQSPQRPFINGRIVFPAGDHLLIGDMAEAYTSQRNVDALYINAEITGPGNLVKSGPGTIHLLSSNSFSGNVVIVEGGLQVGHPQALGNLGGDTRLAGGTLWLDNVKVSGERLVAQSGVTAARLFGSSLASFGSSTWDGDLSLETNLVIEGNVTFTAPISGPGGMDFFSGSSQITGPLPNTYTGRTVVEGAFLGLNKSPRTAAYSGSLEVIGQLEVTNRVRWFASHQNNGAPIIVSGLGRLDLNGYDDEFGLVTFNGGLIETGDGTFTTLDDVQQIQLADRGRPRMNGKLSISPKPSGFPRFIVLDGLQIDAQISGNTSWVKEGLGILILSGSNSYGGVTIVEEGGVLITDSSALGSPLSQTIVSSNATLAVMGDGLVINEPIFLSGNGSFKPMGALNILSGSCIFKNLNLDTSSRVYVPSGAELTVGGTASGTATLTKAGPGTFTFSGPSNNQFKGDVQVTDGVMNLTKLPAHLVIGPPEFGPSAVARLANSDTQGSTPVTVNAGGLLDFNNYNAVVSVLKLNDGGRVQTGNGTMLFAPGAVVSVGSQSLLGSHRSASIQGNITIAPNDVLTFAVNPYAPFPPFDFGPELDLGASISVPGENLNLVPAQIVKAGLGQLRLSGVHNTYTGANIVQSGLLRIDSTQPSTPVRLDGGSLAGAGTVGPVYFAGSTGSVVSGRSPSILYCGDFIAGPAGKGTLQPLLAGSTAGSGYSQVKAHGTVNLTGLNLQVLLNYVPSEADKFVLIDNDGTEPVQGTFNGLPQNARLSVAGESFSIDYQGGDGNDVVLKHLSPLDDVVTIWTNRLGGAWEDLKSWSSRSVPNGTSAAVTNFGSFKITNNSPAAVADFYYDSLQCTWISSADVTITGLFTWKSGALGGPGVVWANGGILLNGLSHLLSSKLLVNGGSAFWADNGSISLDSGAVLSNAFGASFEFTGDGTVENGNGRISVRQPGLAAGPIP